MLDPNQAAAAAPDVIAENEPEGRQGSAGATPPPPAAPARPPLGLRFSIAGIPVSVEASFVLVIGALAVSGGWTPGFVAAWVVLAAISILVHELGHAVAFRAFGASPRIRLMWFGGVTYGTDDLTPGRSFVVSAAGPVSGLALGALIWILTTTVLVPPSRDVAVLVALALFMNIGWSLFNLLPILPLDGSHLVGAVLRRVVPARATVISVTLSIGVAVAIAFLAFRGDQPFLGAFVLFLAVASLGALANPRDAEAADRSPAG